MSTWRAGRRPMVVPALVVLASVGLVGCAGPAGGQGERSSDRLVVRIADGPPATAYEVHLAEAHGDYRAVRTMRSGETRSFAVPPGWLTVRVPGLCVVPTPDPGGTTVEVGRGACTVR